MIGCLRRLGSYIERNESVITTTYPSYDNAQASHSDSDPSVTFSLDLKKGLIKLVYSMYLLYSLLVSQSVLREFIHYNRKIKTTGQFSSRMIKANNSRQECQETDNHINIFFLFAS